MVVRRAVLLLVLSCASGQALACPGVVFGLELTPFPRGPRKGMRLFAKSAVQGEAQGQTAWRMLALQIDPVDKDGRLVFYKDDNYLRRDLKKQDLMTLRPEDFGERFDAKVDVLPCHGATVWELRDPSKERFAYLTSCGFMAPLQSSPAAVSFNMEGHTLEGPAYLYRFNPENYLQFDAIGFRPNASLSAAGVPRVSVSPGAVAAAAPPASVPAPAVAPVTIVGPPIPTNWDYVAKDSRLLIRADVKNFFTMNFDSRQIESHLEDHRLGPVADLARLSFFLKILVFKIRMSLSTDVMFFADTGHIPMMVNVPVDSAAWLHPRSGILYSWEPTPLALGGKPDVRMPLLDVELTKKGFAELGKSGAQICKAGVCDFRYIVDVGGRRLSMDMQVRKELVERGFFPQYVPDVAAAKESMGWDVDTPTGTHRMGMYFEVSGLPEGGHPWDFWLRLGAPEAGGVGDSICPATLRLKRL